MNIWGEAIFIPVCVNTKGTVCAVDGITWDWFKFPPTHTVSDMLAHSVTACEPYISSLAYEKIKVESRYVTFLNI